MRPVYQLDELVNADLPEGPREYFSSTGGGCQVVYNRPLRGTEGLQSEAIPGLFGQGENQQKRDGLGQNEG